MLLMGGIFAFCLIFMAGRLGYLMIGQADKYPRWPKTCTRESGKSRLPGEIFMTETG